MVPAQKVRVLVVEDDANLGRTITAQLIRRGLDVTSAGSAEEALRVVRVYEPALILLGLSAPSGNVLDALERMKQTKPEAAVVLLSAQHDPEIIFQASKLGADDYLSKPFEAKDLDFRINKLLEKRSFRRRRAAARPGPA